MRSKRLRVSLCAAALLMATGILVQNPAEEVSHQAGRWLTAGHDVSGTRNQPAEHILRPSNVSMLAAKWVFTTEGSVSATPTVFGKYVYFPDWKGNLYAVDKNTGEKLWSTRIADYDGVPGSFSRTSPAIYGDMLILGDIEPALQKGANLIAVNRFTGELIWITQVESHPAAKITASPVVVDKVVYQGVSSGEEGLAFRPNYQCCTFRGSVVAVDVDSGSILWKTYTVPDNGGLPGAYSGAAVWMPVVVDPRRRLLYVGTGNNYTVPAGVMACQTANPTAVTCSAPEDYFDTVLALDLRTGAVRWSHRLWGYDATNAACVPPAKAACPSPKGEDTDLGGSGGNLNYKSVGFVQKNGFYWAFNPVDGSTLWKARINPSAGVQWGTATDGQRIYADIPNWGHATYTLASGQTITSGSWTALDSNTGGILWQTPDPTPGTIDSGAMTVANGVVYVGSMSGYMYALNAATGAILWSFNSGGSVVDGPAIVDGVVYWGSGYDGKHGPANNKVYAFSLPKSALRHDK